MTAGRPGLGAGRLHRGGPGLEDNQRSSSGPIEADLGNYRSRAASEVQGALKKAFDLSAPSTYVLDMLRDRVDAAVSVAYGYP